jgi:general secretion pathway protein N
MRLLAPSWIAAMLVLVPGTSLAIDALPQAQPQQAQPQQPEPQQAQPPQAEAQAAAVASPLAIQSLDRLSATRDRPLFSPTRRPPAPPPPIVVAPAPPPPPPPPPPNVALYGVVMDGEEARAVIRSGPTEKVVRVRIGDNVGGWRVAQIEGRKLVLALDGRLATFTMFVGNKAKGAPTLPIQNELQQNQLQQNQVQPSTQLQQDKSQPTERRRRRRQTQ